MVTANQAIDQNNDRQKGLTKISSMAKTHK